MASNCAYYTCELFATVSCVAIRDRPIVTKCFLILTAGALGLAGALGCYPVTGASSGGAPLAESTAPEAGIIAQAGPVPGRVRVLYARNGAMVLLREIRVPGGEPVHEISLSADGRDLFVATEQSAYTFSTRTGRIEAQSLLAAEYRHALGTALPRG